jgi:ethanolamine utilization protein EutJ
MNCHPVDAEPGNWEAGFFMDKGNRAVIDERLRRVRAIVNDETPVRVEGALHVGIDLGTADVVAVVVDHAGEPVAAFLEWADVVRDGVVLDYWGAIGIVKDMMAKIYKRTGREVTDAVTAYPPGTDPYASINVLQAAGLRVTAVVDEPSSVALLLGIEEGAVVDIGGGTTGISVVLEGSIVKTADEATGGRHVTLTIAGNRRIPYDEAEIMKRTLAGPELQVIATPVFEKMTDIVRSHIASFDVPAIYLTGGTCCFPGVEALFRREFPEIEIVLPSEPLYLTPLAIASYGL